MTDLPPQAVEAALAAAASIPRNDLTGFVHAALEAAEPHIAAAERQAFAAVISPEQFRKLADWFDADDEFKEAMFPETWSPGSRQNDVQRDLRAVADLLDGDQ